MRTDQEVATRGSTAVERKPEGSSAAIESESRQNEVPLMPAVDILEDAHQITVQAEMPGVSKEGLNVRADRNSLLIEGDIALTLPPGMSALYADLQTTKYRRTFVLS